MKPIPTLASLFLFTCSTMLHAERMPREDVIEFPAHQEGLYLHHLFQSNMVLQRDQPIGIWGWADAGESITATFGDATEKVTAGKDGAWKVTFPARSASNEPSNLKITGSKKTIELTNILIGDVWVLGGQSNMAFEISKVENGQLEIVSANYPQIRMLNIPHGEGPKMKTNFARLHQWSDWSGRHFRRGDWEVCSPDTVSSLSAIGYVFARRVHMASQVPIGVINTSRGGTTVETWTPLSLIKSMDQEPVKNLLATWDQKVADYDPQADLENQIKRYESKVKKLEDQGKPIPDDLKKPTEARPGPEHNSNYPGSCYAAMISPIEGIRVKGAIFHQGFNNCFSGSEGVEMYRYVFPEMIKAWRQAFNDPAMPFGILSLCTAGNAQTFENYTEQMRDAGAYIRDVQYNTYLKLHQAGDEDIGFTSTYDLRRRWYHPQLKIPAGERIARWALATEYGFDKSLQWEPAELTEMKVDNDKILLTYNQSISNVDDGSDMTGFAIAGEDRKFHPAVISHLVTGKDNRNRDIKDTKTVVLTSPMVPQPKHYRFAWARNPMANIQIGRNSDIPLPTQRSDDWPLEEVPLIDNPTPDKPLSKKAINDALKAIDNSRNLHEAQTLIDSLKTQ